MSKKIQKSQEKVHNCTDNGDRASSTPGTHLDDKRQLSNSEIDTWHAVLGATRKLFSQVDRDLISQAGIPLFYHQILVHLAGAPEHSLRMNELSEATQSIPSSISHAISRLEEDGLVVRTHCPQDRRGWFAVLTELGSDRLAESNGALSRSLRRHLFDLLNEKQIVELTKTLGLINSEIPNEI